MTRSDSFASLSSGWPDQPAIPGEAEGLRPLSGVWLWKLEDWYLPGHPSCNKTIWSQPSLWQCGVFSSIFNFLRHFTSSHPLKGALTSVVAAKLNRFYDYLVSMATSKWTWNWFFYRRRRLCRHSSNQKLWMGPTSTSVNAAKRNVMPGRLANGNVIWESYSWNTEVWVWLASYLINISLYRVWDFCISPTCWHCSWSGLILTTPLCIVSSSMTAWLSLRSLTWVHLLMWKMRWEQLW